MRILHLDAGREMRGGQWQVYRLLEGLARQGVGGTLLARPGSPLFEKSRAAGLPVESLRFGNLLRLAARHDLVHAHDARSHTLGLLAGKPLVVSRRVAFPVRSRWKYARADHFVAVSEFVQSVLRTGGVPLEKISVVYDGVPLLEPARGEGVLAPANAADPQKGAGLAQEAARLAAVPLRLSCKLESDLPGAAIFLYLSYSEGLGSAVLLAMSAGLAVVASAVGGLSEVIRHRENGLLVENSAASVASALRELAGNPETVRRFGHAARQTIAQRFTVDLMLRHTMEVYRRVLS